MDDILTTTIHELAHASHWDMEGTSTWTWKIDDNVAESWCRGVQWEFTRLIYPWYAGGTTNKKDTHKW